MKILMRFLRLNTFIFDAEQILMSKIFCPINFWNSPKIIKSLQRAPKSIFDPGKTCNDYNFQF